MASDPTQSRRPSPSAQLEAVQTPRLLALWERPQFAWTLRPGQEDPLALLV